VTRHQHPGLHASAEFLSAGQRRHHHEVATCQQVLGYKGDGLVRAESFSHLTLELGSL
jgi:hypothetical protein